MPQPQSERPHHPGQVAATRQQAHAKPVGDAERMLGVDAVAAAPPQVLGAADRLQALCALMRNAVLSCPAPFSCKASLVS
jgi:hypothetical protein